MDQALANMTGGITQRFDLRKDEAKQMVQNGTLWRTLLDFKGHGFLMGAGSPNGSDSESNTSKLGIVQGQQIGVRSKKRRAPVSPFSLSWIDTKGHAYAVLDIQEVDNIQLMRLRKFVPRFLFVFVS